MYGRYISIMQPLTPPEEDVWRALVRLVVVLPRIMDEDLQSGSGLSLTHYLVLMRLSEADDHQLRMSDLAERAALSPSRMTRIVQSLEGQDLIRRVGSSHDGRSNFAILTDAGLARLEGAWPTHLTSARTLIINHLDPKHLADVAEVVREILRAAETPWPQRSGTPQPPRS